MSFSSSFKSLVTISLTSAMLLACSNTNTQSAVANESAHQTSESTSSSRESTSNEQVIANLQKNLKTSGVNATIQSVTKTDINGLYWVTTKNVPAFLTDTDGKYIFQGQIIEVGGAEPIDVSAQLNAKFIAQSLADVDKKELIIFPAKGEKRSAVYVFTDTTCGYCRKFHEQVTDLNAKGVEVRYLAWPRSQQARPLMESIWCSEDPNKAMTQSKQNKAITPASCDSPVRKQTQLGHKIGLSGTPAVYTESGEQLGGYLPTAQLLEALGL